MTEHIPRNTPIDWDDDRKIEVAELHQEAAQANRSVARLQRELKATRNELRICRTALREIEDIAGSWTVRPPEDVIAILMYAREGLKAVTAASPSPSAQAPWRSALKARRR